MKKADKTYLLFSTNIPSKGNPTISLSKELGNAIRKKTTC